MYNFDAPFLEFVRQNLICLGLLIGLLKILAKRSKTTLDDSILSYLGGFLDVLKKNRGS